jgi:peptidoglycan-associated lipoprotein
MQKRVRFYVVSLVLIAAFATVGCAKQDVVKKDEGIIATPIAKQVDPPKPEQPKVTNKITEAYVAPVVTKIAPLPATAQIVPKTATNEQVAVSLATIYFDFDSAGLSDSARSSLSTNAALLTKESAATIRIEGNCDERGSAEYNLALGERRAHAVHKYLVTMGVEQGRLSTVSYGNEKPAVQGSDEATWAKNRRAEFVIVSP